MAERQKLSSVQALTFYKDSLTTYRRTRALPQLICISGKVCKLFEPEAVRCINIGGQGSDIDWQCEADLPASLRFGKVTVGCEGWSKPGDPYILKGSCSLEYRLVVIPESLRSENAYIRPPRRSWFGDKDASTIIFQTIWFAVLAFILYSFIKSYFRRNNNGTPQTPRTGGGGSGGWFPGDYGSSDNGPSPPPYSETYPKDPTTRPGTAGWTPGFWTGTLLGSLGASYFANNNNRDRDRGQQRRAWDWERERTGPGFVQPLRRPIYDSNDRGEGSSTGSNLGSMRRSTAYGDSNVR